MITHNEHNVYITNFCLNTSKLSFTVCIYIYRYMYVYICIHDECAYPNIYQPFIVGELTQILAHCLRIAATRFFQVIDIWSAACVSAELILGHPMFPGESGVDQLVGPQVAACHRRFALISARPTRSNAM